jgi:coproporphyrinogen III oxidase-like Fe-S oxidoreductase
LGPTHVSYYQLTLEPGTVFYSRPPPLPDEDSAWRMQTEGQRLLSEAGFEQYEVSAYARSGARCRHNLNYWLFGDYIGIGAGAHGKVSMATPSHILRTVKPKQPGEYQVQAMRMPAIGERQAVATQDLPFEFMLNALRLNEGFSDECFEARTGLSLGLVQPLLEDAGRRGLVAHRAGGWQPTALGRRFLNDLQATFLA